MFAAAARPIFSSFARASARRFAWVNPKQASTAADAASQSGGGAGLAIALCLLGFAGGGALAYYQFSDGTLRLVAPIADGSKNIAADFEAKLAPNGPFAGVLDMVGHTPLIELKSLSAATGCRIFAKAEHMNPGHSVKDRAARQMVLEAEKDGRLKPGGTIVEATGGNTGVGLAMVAAAKGYKAIFTMPDYVTKEKQNSMRVFGAEVRPVPPCPFANPAHFYHQAARIAAETPGAVFLNQFENDANFRAHYTGTGPEIWHQLGRKLDAFVCAMGTGGTMAGCSTYLREQNPMIVTAVIDPPGSALLGYFQSGGRTMTAEPGNTILQGVGLARKTRMVEHTTGKVDGGFRANDLECIEMCQYLLRNEGLYVGPTAAANVCGAVKLAKKMGPGHRIATVLCDHGSQYATTAFNPVWLKEKNLVPTSTGTSIDFIKVDKQGALKQASA